MTIFRQTKAHGAVNLPQTNMAFTMKFYQDKLAQLQVNIFNIVVLKL